MMHIVGIAILLMIAVVGISDYISILMRGSKYYKGDD